MDMKRLFGTIKHVVEYMDATTSESGVAYQHSIWTALHMNDLVVRSEYQFLLPDHIRKMLIMVAFLHDIGSTPQLSADIIMSKRPLKLEGNILLDVKKLFDDVDLCYNDCVMLIALFLESSKLIVASKNTDEFYIKLKNICDYLEVMFDSKDDKYFNMIVLAIVLLNIACIKGQTPYANFVEVHKRQTRNSKSLLKNVYVNDTLDYYPYLSNKSSRNKIPSNLQEIVKVDNMKNDIIKESSKYGKKYFYGK
jgi:hypothetical protein